MIQIRNLHKAFSKNKVLEGVDIHFDRPGITAVLGPNGSGKSTLIKCILGMVIPDRGQVWVNGQDIKNKWAYRNHIDYLPQIARFPENLKVRELIDMVKNLRARPAKDLALIELFGLEPFLDKRLGQLSGGTRQKFNLVQALMFDSPILILDEPTTGLDPVAMIGLRKLLQEEKEKGRTILITTHIMSFAEEVADHVIFLLDGQVKFDGSVPQLKTQCGEDQLEKAIAWLLRRGAAPEWRGEKLEELMD